MLVTVAPFGDPIELRKQAPGVFVAALRPDTFRLTLPATARRREFDWMEHAPTFARARWRTKSAEPKQNYSLNEAADLLVRPLPSRTLRGKGRRTMRSKLFVPGSRAELFAKALAGDSRCDLV